MIQLRPNQERCIADIKAHMADGVHSVLLCAATGFGKTYLTAEMIHRARSKNMVAWFVNHRREILTQSMKSFTEVGVKYGVCSAGFYPEKNIPVQICSVQTLMRRYHKYPKPNLIIWDEAHHLGAKSWTQLFKEFPNAYHVGLTATPVRLDGKGLGAYFQKMVLAPNTHDLIEQGYLSKYRIFAPPGISVAGLHTRAGDYANDELARVVDKPTITGSAILEYKKKSPGKRAVVFAVSIEHSKHIVAQFQANGISAAHVDGETDKDTRDRCVREFSEGKIKVLSNVELFGEGFDLPALEVAILLRPTQSTGLFLQQVGRALRPFPGKSEALILDHAGNTERHGLPDEEREWTLDGISDGNKVVSKAIRIKTCGKCFAVIHPGPPACPYCGYIFETEGRKVEEKEGELQEIDLQALREKKREQGRAQSREELISLGKARGYKNPYAWAHIVLQSRQRKKLQAGRPG